jgi:hypothetical protein
MLPTEFVAAEPPVTQPAPHQLFRPGVILAKLAGAGDVGHLFRLVKAYLNLLVDIHPEVVELLKDKNVAPKTIKLLRQVSGVRQIEIAEFMVGAGNYTHGFAAALVLGTDPEQLAKPAAVKKHKGFSREAIARMEQEIQTHISQINFTSWS